MARITEVEKTEIWDQYRDGAPIRLIGRRLGRPRSTIQAVLTSSGGIRPLVRCRDRRHLTGTEREEISRGVAAGESGRAIAGRLGRSASTICRELARNGGRGRYRAARAERAAWKRAKRPKTAKLAADPFLALVVETKLAAWWSPEQIAGWLPTVFPDSVEMRVSHETIYQSLFIQSRGALRRELTQCLRTHRAIRRPRTKRTRTGKGQIREPVMISERPAEADDRAVPGHWEGDLVMGTLPSAIGTLVERHSRFVMLFPLPDGHTAQAVRTALASTIQRLPGQLWRSLTWDQGKEMAEHATFTIDTGLQVYFCDPKSPWQRGSNENTNGLLRQYLPKKTDMSTLTQDQLDTIAYSLNTRPRQTLNFQTPLQVLAQTLH